MGDKASTEFLTAFMADMQEHVDDVLVSAFEFLFFFSRIRFMHLLCKERTKLIANIYNENAL